jgi:hypothetical protein
MSLIYYEGPKALDKYKAWCDEQYPSMTFTKTTCPHCGRLSIHVENGANGTYPESWVDVLTFQENGKPVSEAWCYLINGMPTRVDSRPSDKADYSMAFWEEKVEKVERLCNCDYDTVIRTIGCQCGGK